MKWSYSGAHFRQYLQRKDISHKQAAEELGIDKNTVGKAVRGGNLNVDIILRICNTYELSVIDFFILEGKEGEETEVLDNADYKNSLDHEDISCSEDEFKYKKCKISDVIDMVNTTKIMLENIAMNEKK